MQLSQRYVIVHFLKAMAEGQEFSPLRYPLHITIIPSFELPSLSQDLLTAITAICAKSAAFHVVAEKNAYFGEAKDIAVAVLARNNDLLALHNELAQLLSQNGALFNEPHHIFKGYRAHSTVQAASRLQIGEQTTIDRLSIIDKLPSGNANNRKIVKTFSFGL